MLVDMEQDYYVILGVDPKAGAREIKRAWLKLARREHPDVNPGDREAAARYALMQEAWRVLSQRALREEYDQPGPPSGAGDRRQARPAARRAASAGAGSRSSGSCFPNRRPRRPSRRWRRLRGEDIHQVLDLSFEEALRGVVRECHYRREGACPECRGRRWAPGSPIETCQSCRGRGVVEVPHGPWTVRKLCPTCDGEGESGEEPCRACRGRGHVPVAEKRAVRVAAGSSVRQPDRRRRRPGSRGGAAANPATWW